MSARKSGWICTFPGAMARSAKDLQLALQVLAGPDGPAARAFKLQLPKARKQKLADFRVGVVLSDPVAEVDQPVQDVISALADWLRAEGATVDMDARPAVSAEDAMEVYTMLLRSATSKRLTDEDIAACEADYAALTGDEIPYRRRMLEGQLLSHRHWLRWNEKRHQQIAAWEDFFQTCDLLLCPAAGSAAFPHDQEGERIDRTIAVNGKQQPTVDQLFWAGYSCNVYMPGTVAPIGQTPDGLPVGVQIVGRQYDDLTCLHMASLIEDGYYKFTPPPAFSD